MKTLKEFVRGVGEARESVAQLLEMSSNRPTKDWVSLYDCLGDLKRNPLVSPETDDFTKTGLETPKP